MTDLPPGAGSPAEPAGAPPAPPHCYVHGNRLAGSVCRRCGRPICPDCMREAPVGWQCPSCVKQGAKASPYVRWRPGGVGTRRITPAISAIVAANVVAFFWEESKYNDVVTRFELWPNRMRTNHEWYRLITSAFLHVSFTHILLNMLTLVIVGPAVEEAIGRARFVALYLAAAVGGSVASYLLTKPETRGIGASGAIFGIMGAYYVLARSRHLDVSSITGLIVINLIFGFVVPHIGWEDHVGGLLTGAAVCFGLDRLSVAARGRGAEIAGAAVVLAAAAVVLTLLCALPPGHVNLS